jgi:hypothetical protein
LPDTVTVGCAVPVGEFCLIYVVGIGPKNDGICVLDGSGGELNAQTVFQGYAVAFSVVRRNRDGAGADGLLLLSLAV